MPSCKCQHSITEHYPRPGCIRCDCAEYDGPEHLDSPETLQRLAELRALEKGQMPGVTRTALPESHYRDMLARQVRGRTEVTLPFGRADVMTDTTVYEVEPVTRWKEGVAQALQYAAQVPQGGAIALYGHGVPLARVHARLATLPAPGLELWWLAGDLFVRVKEVKARTQQRVTR
jgi:hypothetical protein